MGSRGPEDKLRWSSEDSQARNIAISSQYGNVRRNGGQRSVKTFAQKGAMEQGALQIWKTGLV